MKYYLSIVAIFKNESHIIQEWLEHYLSEGVNHFYLIDNGSCDDYINILQPYIKDKQVDLVIDATTHSQIQHYNNYFLQRTKQETEWVMIVDLDEFVYGRGQYRNITQYLHSINQQVGQIYVPWKCFGSNGLINQPLNIVDNMVYRTKYQHVKTNGMLNNETMLSKTIIRTKYLDHFGIHFALLKQTDVEITSDNQPISQTNKEFQNISESVLRNSALHCNHYPIQSFSFFERVKMTRGSANTAQNDKVRTYEYFNSYDLHSNQQIDNELSNKKHGFRVYYGDQLTYIDVTRKIYQYFRNNKNNGILIPASTKFNEYFGDPVPFSSKYLIVYQSHHLMIYPEMNHGNIEIGSVLFP